jgi:predicted permease
MGTLRIAVRTLLRQPSFSLIAVLTLALGLGATAAIYTVVDEVVLDPLPYPEPGELVRVGHPAPGYGYGDRHWPLSEGGWYVFRDASRTLEDLAIYEVHRMVLSGEGVADRVAVARVSGNLFDVLGARPSMGRLLRESDHATSEPVGLVSHAFWQTRLGGDPSVVGSVLRVEGIPVEVVGVLEPGFDLPDRTTALWLPAEVSREREHRNWHHWESIARLQDGVTPAAAEADLRRVMQTFPQEVPLAYSEQFMEESGFDVAVTPLAEHVIGGVDRALWILLAAVGIILLIGCANVANLFLVRLEAGRREYAVRTALGASRWDIGRRAMAESLVLMAVAAAVGVVLSGWALELVLEMAPDLPRVNEVAVGWDTAAFTVLLAGLVGVVFGAIPAVRSRPSIEALKEGAGLTASRRRATVRGGLVVLEMALALVVLVGAGLMLRSFEKLRSVDPGFEPEGVLAVDVALPAAEYRGWLDVAGFYRQLTEQVSALPGVAATGATQKLPLTSPSYCAGMALEDPEAQERYDACFIDPNLVTPGYFEAMGIPVDGSAPTWNDMLARRGQVVVSRPLRDKLWPGEEPAGQGIRGNGSGPPFYRVAGIAGPVRHDGLDQPPVHRVYFPMLPMEGANLWSPPRAMTLVVRSAGPPPAALAAPVRAVIRGLDAGVAVGQVRPMTAVVAASTARTTFVMLLLGIAASVALVLGVIGLYGVVAYVAAQRRAEIGIRMALGARGRTVRGMVVGQAARLAGLGTVIGVAGAVAVSRVLSSQLYEVGPTDPVTLAGAALLLVGVALAAAWIPARRASQVEPMRVLRSE